MVLFKRRSAVSYIFPQEREVLEMLAGLRPRTSEVWVDACLKTLFGAGFCTDGPGNRLTPEGRAILGLKPQSPY
jgi:hypothetical protein